MRPNGEVVRLLKAAWLESQRCVTPRTSREKEKCAQNVENNWSGQRDLNPRLPAPKAGALPDCAMPRRRHPMRVV